MSESESKNIDSSSAMDQSVNVSNTNIAASEVSSVAGTVKQHKHTTTAERQIKYEKAQKCLENAAAVSKRIKEHRKVTAELLGRPFDEDVGDTASEMASTMSEKTGYSVATDTSTTLSVQDALNIPGISESLANTLKQKEILMERIKQYKEISKRPMKKAIQITKKDSVAEALYSKKPTDNTDVSKLINTIKEKENNVSVMQVKMKAMETTILDLQEKINEKDQIIEAKNRATTLMSDSLSKKEKEAMELLEDTKQQMTIMQTNFVTMEKEWKEEKQELLSEIEKKNDKIKHLEEANMILENSRFEISLAHSKLLEEIELKTKEVIELQEQIKQLSGTNEPVVKETHEEVMEEKGSLEISSMEELTKKIELLEHINFEIRQTNKDLENQLNAMNIESKTNVSPSKKGSPLPSRKGSRNTTSKMKSPWSKLSSESLQQETDKKGKSDKSKQDMLLQSLNKEILEKEYLLSQKDNLISELQSLNVKNETTISELELLLKSQKETVKMVNIGTDTDLQEPTKMDAITLGTITDLEEKLKLAQEQIAALSEEIEVANKNMVKVKSNSKLKLKQMQKTIDNFSKVSDAHVEIVKLNEELHQLTQKVAELEEEKGNLQLHLVDYDSGRLTETEIYKKMIEMENLAEARLKSISLLETQKFDLVQELHSLQQKNLEMEDKLADISLLQNEQVCSEMNSVQLEEQIDDLQAAKKELELIVDNLKLDKEQLNGTIKTLQNEKEELIQKLDNYIQENIELTDKLEKLSAEKVSSAESIEIVESLTTQEKLELEEYNKGLESEKKVDESKLESYKVSDSQEYKTSNEKLIEETLELKTKIELFTSERKEVMEKMNKMSLENDSLNKIIIELEDNCNSLRNKIDLLNEEKDKLLSLNDELNHQIEELKHERTEILKETAEMTKPLTVEDAVDGSIVETLHHDEKSTGDKGNSKTKSVKQLTKEILKLKNVIKEREDEIADCQMKILSLEEQHEKQKEVSQNSASFEKLLKKLSDENIQLKNDIENISKDKDNKVEQYMHLVQTHELLQIESQKMHQEYATALNARDSRIHELENLLLEYEKQVINYSNTLQQKDKEMSEYINQITKLNDVSQKLKSTIDLLEEEKAKDQNAELVKSLNKQIGLYQKSLADYEEKLRILEDDKTQLGLLKSQQESQINGLELELKKLQDSLTEKQNLIKEMQINQQKQTEELSNVLLQSKERDEEIHEIKLQLRKESIDNEKLHNIVVQKSNDISELKKLYDDATEKLNFVSNNTNIQNEQYSALELKNKELTEKLKKFALNIKKKSAMYSELEQQYQEVQKQLEIKNEQYEQLSIQVETIPALQEKLKHAEEEFNRLQTLKIVLEQKSQEILQLQSEVEDLRKNSANDAEKITLLNETLESLKKDLYFAREENSGLKSQIDSLNNRIVEYEIDQKNNANLLTKISCLEADLSEKLHRIDELSNQIEDLKEKLSQVQFGHDAKVQERDLYIESLQSEIDRYKNRINRLEESISIMESRRQSLECKADQLDSQLHEKQNAYNEYTCQEDELVTRLALLMDNDRVVEKQLNEIENENKDLHLKIQHLNEELQNVQQLNFELQQKYSQIESKAKEAEAVDSMVSTYESQIRELDANLKKITYEHNTLSTQKQREIEDLESEFNTQIENAIKDKKILNEKYEKIKDYVSQLESKLQEYRVTVDSHNANLEELALQNQKLAEKLTNNDKSPSSDYTEQYITEINNLNSILNSKNQEISDLCGKIHSLQSQNLSQASTLDNKNMDLTQKTEILSLQIINLVKEIDSMKENNDQLQMLLCQKDEQIKQLMENKKVVFEMNIPKTEGMTISSTIESMDNEPKDFDISSLHSQIISDADSVAVETEQVAKIVTEKTQKQSSQSLASEGLIESTIVPKKAYLCYKEQEDDNKEPDPFNSEEGWGLGTNEEIDNVVPGYAHLNQQIHQLDDENKKLRVEINTTNAKLLKALKKLRDLKVTNDMLSNELKLSKQISQSSLLDMAIESELSSNLEVLEKKVQELNTELNKEKKEKDAIKKQNEIFKNANDRLLEMKEKLENELELWKFNFKQATDKISSLQWGGDPKDSTHDTQETPSVVQKLDESELNKNLLKVEEENDQLQIALDSVNSENKKLSILNDNLKEEINNLKRQQHQRLIKCDNCDNLIDKNKELTVYLDKLEDEISKLKDNLKQQNLIFDNSEKLKDQLEQLQIAYAALEQNKTTMLENLQHWEMRYNELLLGNKELLEKNDSLAQEMQSLRASESEANSKISMLNVELDELKSKLFIAEDKLTEANAKVSDLSEELKDMKTNLTMSEENRNIKQVPDFNAVALAEKCGTMEEYCLNLKNNLDKCNTKIQRLELENKELLDKVSNYEHQITELENKLQNLNSENDQLLSTVAELRSSISSAMDQRGFEIAELWKQHLSQRESEFQKIEQDLRDQLNASQAKYEQILENVQSSNEEETNKIIMAEHISSLQNKLKEKEEHIVNLREKYAEVINQLDLLRSEMEDEKVIQENKVFVHQVEYEKIIQELKLKNQDQCLEYENKIKNLQTELEATKTVNDSLNQQADDVRNVYEAKISDLTRQLQVKESEIFQNTHDFTVLLTQRNEEFETVRKQLLEYEKKVEDLTYEKESELAILRLKMHERAESSENVKKDLENENNILAESIKEKIIECTNLNKQIHDLNKVLEEYINKTAETQVVLESQEIEIVTLKDEISSLKDALRAVTSKTEKFVTFASDTKPGDDSGAENTLDRELLDAVPRAELDLALYMLHQRDVRCEELTMELTQLLEERDTLQLRLSDSLRSYEELKSRCTSSGLDISVSSSHEGTSELPSFSVEKEGSHFVDTHRGHISRSSSIGDTSGEKPKLQAKLTELRSVRHSRDVRLRHDSEQRQLGMRLLQRDVANLPPEAVEQLAQAHHTLSRDTQSTPTVLLNWLRGKSTPKVVHM
ncbi:protein lava lamp-like [Maniola jurtina]|uniref:protein lava lamp-like n=1 Tax=Maniola jurtina TaxID=191418 RepID=UPI001E68AB7A|nr:protein lava lamp-like [Maniola jurtina]